MCHIQFLLIKPECTVNTNGIQHSYTSVVTITCALNKIHELLLLGLWCLACVDISQAVSSMLWKWLSSNKSSYHTKAYTGTHPLWKMWRVSWSLCLLFYIYLVVTCTMKWNMWLVYVCNYKCSSINCCSIKLFQQMIRLLCSECTHGSPSSTKIFPVKNWNIAAMNTFLYFSNLMLWRWQVTFNTGVEVTYFKWYKNILTATCM